MNLMYHFPGARNANRATRHYDLLPHQAPQV